MSHAHLPQRLALIFSFCLGICVAICLMPASATADAANFSDAAPMNSSDFLKQLKAVKLTLTIDPWVAKYVSEDQFRAEVTRTLDQHGIAIDADAPVSALLLIEQVPRSIKKTILYTNNTTDEEILHKHVIYYNFSFFVQATAYRGGKFHRVLASPANNGSLFTCEEGNTFRQVLFGDELKETMGTFCHEFLPKTINGVFPGSTDDPTAWPWAVSALTEPQKNALNDRYTAFMNTAPAIEKRPADGLDAAPSLALTSDIKADGVTEDPSWKKFWLAECQNLGWTRAEDIAPVSVVDHYLCMSAANDDSCFQISDQADLWESNLVFDFNGRLVRSLGDIFTHHHFTLAVQDEVANTLENFVSRNIQEFDADLRQGDQPLPEIKAPPAPAAGPVSLETKLVKIEPGMFVMGSPESEAGRSKNETQHAVKLTKPFFMAMNDVTRAQFTAFVTDTGYVTDAEKSKDENTWRLNKVFEQDDTQPVVNVSWADAVAYASWLSKKDGKTYRLPTEAEWEFACRAGTTTPFNTGATISSDQANYDGTAIYGPGAKGVCRWKTTPVGSFPANQWGLCDMHGNVWQWCADVSGDYPADAVTNPTGPAPDAAGSHILRGGSWGIDPLFLRSASRLDGGPASHGGYNVGFRVVADTP